MFEIPVFEYGEQDRIANLSTRQLRRELAKATSRWTDEEIASMSRRELIDLVIEALGA